MATRINDETVEELRDTVRGLLEDENRRAASLQARGGGVVGFIGVIVGVALAASANDNGVIPGLHGWEGKTVAGLLILALLLLVGAAGSVVMRVLLPDQGIAIALEEVERYPFPEWISKDTTLVRGHLMRGYIASLKTDRDRNQSKARWLRRAYVLILWALALVAAAAVIAIFDGDGNASGARCTPTRTALWCDRPAGGDRPGAWDSWWHGRHRGQRDGEWRRP